MYDLLTAKLRLGLLPGDVSKDVAIRSALNVALALAERYCDRAFIYASETARFPRNDWPRLLVRRYPIKQVLAVRGPTGTAMEAPAYEVSRDAGIIYLGSGWAGWSAWGGGVIEVDYEGGYQVLPADLEEALWQTFQAVWDATPGMGLPPGSGSSAGAVRSFSIDGMSIGYDNNSGSSSSGSDGGHGAIPGWAIATLDFYRAETAVGGA